MAERFHVETETIDNGPGIMNSLRVSVFESGPTGKSKIGEYVRNHAGLYNTFFPFQQHGKWYALYSRDYTATRVMELPSCRDIAGEEPDTNGFCPVDFYVPFLEERVTAAGHAGLFGFVAGCIWGDDSSWKIQYLDLSKVWSGRLAREERFGYIAMPREKARLSECISMGSYCPPESPVITITATIHFNSESGRQEAYV